MQPDTTFVAQATELVTNPAFTNMLIGAIVAILTYIIGVIKLPKGIAAKIVQYAVIVVIAIMETEKKANIAEAREKGNIPTSSEKLILATQFVENEVFKSPNRSVFDKIGKVLGVVGSVVNIAFPIIKPFLKK